MNQRGATSTSSAASRTDAAGGLLLQERLLPGVSRTFALTIPVLPPELRAVVTNGYLLCRIADTIEDEPALGFEEKKRFHSLFSSCVAGDGDPEALAAELHPRLSARTIAAERELIAHLAAVIEVTHGFAPAERAPLARCVRIMCEGMSAFQAPHHPRGLRDLGELERYCYVVAGVVGEMLTSLFCSYSSEIDAHRARLSALAVSFGQGLQLTNILKDIWDDLGHGFCWLPGEVFARAGFDLSGMRPGSYSPAFGAALGEILAVAHGNLRDALEYTLLIPAKERGIRRFCLWALGMAVLTLRKIERHRDFASARDVKITRRSVKATVLACNAFTGSDRMLRRLFSLFAHRLPAPPMSLSTP